MNLETLGNLLPAFTSPSQIVDPTELRNKLFEGLGWRMVQVPMSRDVDFVDANEKTIDFMIHKALSDIEDTRALIRRVRPDWSFCIEVSRDDKVTAWFRDAAWPVNTAPNHPTRRATAWSISYAVIAAFIMGLQREAEVNKLQLAE